MSNQAQFSGSTRAAPEGQPAPPMGAPVTAAISDGQLFDALQGILANASNAQALRVLRAVAGAHGHRVIPGTGLAMPGSTGPGGRRRDGTAPRPPRDPPSRGKTPAQREAQAGISRLNKEISEKSKTLGQDLTPDDPLLVERAEYFRCLKD